MRISRIFLFSVALITLLVPVASYGQDGVDRPFQAVFTGSATWSWPGTWPSHCTIVTTVTDATGQATHLGSVGVSASHCPAEPAYVIDGRMTITAANGDTLTGQYDYDPQSTSHSVAVAWTGGTGRFMHATGAATLTFNVVQQFIAGCDPVPNPFPCFDFSVPWPWSASLVGTIKY